MLSQRTTPPAVSDGSFAVDSLDRASPRSSPGTLCAPCEIPSARPHPGGPSVLTDRTLEEAALSATADDLLLARHLVDHFGGNDVAWLTAPARSPDAGAIFCAHATPTDDPHLPTSPIIDLIQGIAESRPGGAHALLRRRIFTTAPVRPVERAFVRVQAKKHTAISRASLSASGGEDTTPLRKIDVSGDACSARDRVVDRHRILLDSGSPDPTDPMALAEWWAERAERSAERKESDRAIGAVLILPDGSVGGGATNLGGRNRTLHAEVNLVQQWWRTHARPIPPGSEVFVTLQSCRMCAAMLVGACEDPHRLRVTYRDRDPGRYARATLLQELGAEVRAAPRGAPDHRTRSAE